MKMTLRVFAAITLVMVTVNLRAQEYKPSPDLEALHVPFDALLDLHVRDGLVYYRALQGDREPLEPLHRIFEYPFDCVGLSGMAFRSEEGILAQRVQRAGVADGREQLSN